eukprot:6632991-Karenia_brevis.AAC.1
MRALAPGCVHFGVIIGSRCALPPPGAHTLGSQMVQDARSRTGCMHFGVIIGSRCALPPPGARILAL